MLQTNALTNEDLDNYLLWNQAVKDYEVMFQTMVLSSRDVMSQWMMEINAQFLSQIGFTVDRLNSLQVNRTSECETRFRSDAGLEIQEIVSQIQRDFEFIQGDYVYLLLDVTDHYVSFNQLGGFRTWASWNMVTRMDIITYLMESYVYIFFKLMFEIQIEEIIIDMEFYDQRISTTRSFAFVELNNVVERFENNLISCWRFLIKKISSLIWFVS